MIGFIKFAYRLISRLGSVGIFIVIIYIVYRVTKTDYSAMDRLVLKSKKELDEDFRNGETPTQEEMEGTFDGAPLAGVLLFRDRYTRELVNIGSWFPWRGKIIDALTQTSGKGTNRIALGPLRSTLFPFDTKVLPSAAAEDEQKFRLDYNVPANPFFIRIVQDDVKRVGGGLYLGALHLDLLGKLWFFTYFGLQRKTDEDE
jgi:hypothetical protein